MLPADFPPASTVRGYFYGWRDSALLSTINGLLVIGARELEGREASPTAGVIDSLLNMKRLEAKVSRLGSRLVDGGPNGGPDGGPRLCGAERHMPADY